ISDADEPAKEQQKLYRKDKGYGEWKTYQEVDSSIQAVTGEDFVKNDFLVRKINEVISKASLPSFNQSDLPNSAEKVVAIFRWLQSNGLTPDQAKDMMVSIKDSVFEDLRPQDIESEYSKMLDS